jgi:hypothetical protein
MNVRLVKDGNPTGRSIAPPAASIRRSGIKAGAGIACGTSPKGNVFFKLTTD